jgi:hypothetical protein
MSASSSEDAFKNKLQGANSPIVVQIILGVGNICCLVFSSTTFFVFCWLGGGGTGTLSSQTFTL